MQSWLTMGLGDGEGEGEGCVGRVVVGGAGDGITVGLSPQLAPVTAAPTANIQIA